MTCEQIRLLLYLDRNDERTWEEENLVAEHLQSCPSCAAEAADITAIGLRVRGIPRRRLSRSHQDALTNRVMLQVSTHPDAAGFILRWLGSHAERTQYALGTALAAICILFSVQSLQDARTLELLEQKTGQVRMRAPGFGVGVASMEANSLQAILSLLSSNTGDRPQTLVDYWKKKYPALATLQLTDNPTEKERRILATEGTALVQELTQWIDARGNHNEK
ncbi:MAG: zf-HC2 domain-containing protein [Ignavibacteriales bacterium]|nr:zf-HC2 domain-containing protein [Ignavibacteriales bacterium]